MSSRTLALFFVFCLLFIGAGCAQHSTPIPVSVAINPQSEAIATGQIVNFTATVTGDTSGVTWSATSGAVDSGGIYTAPSGPQSVTVTVTATSKKDPRKSASATLNVVVPGQLSSTANPQVALYTVSPAGAANVLVQFGIDANYALTTWTQPVTQGGTASLFVAGMKANTPYHVRGLVNFADGTQFTDTDHTFMTGAMPATQMPAMTATTTPGMAPQSGVEQLDLLAGGTALSPVAITDLGGNILWSYYPGATLAALQVNPSKLLPNGHILVNFSGSPDGANSVLQEVDLSGTVIWQMTTADLNAALAEATCAGCNITVLGTHHDFAILPNGHLILIASTEKNISGTTVQGDVLIDLDENHKPVWLWNEFDYLDVSRQPMGFPDWTHTNAVVYSADDGNLLVSIRHQNWIVKVDYENGQGSGNILWKLGYQGDFALMGGTDPTDWFYAQHGPSFVSTNTSGVFSLVLFDNGNDRVYGPGFICGGSSGVTCPFSTVPLFQIDESAKTATLQLHSMAATYSFFGGNASVLKNGNVEYCESAGGPGTAGSVYEVTKDPTAQVVWHLQVTGQYPYRGHRIPSLYPGVQW
jgi:arylsulfate sulfotransferase